MDERTMELRAAHDVIAPLYATALADHIDRTPVDRAVLQLFSDLVHSSDLGTVVSDLGCGTGRLSPLLTALGLITHGLDLSAQMVSVARRDNPMGSYAVADLRAVPYRDASLAGVLCWYSLMYLPPDQLDLALAEVARVLSPGGHLVVAYKVGDDRPQRGGHGLGVGFDIWWRSEASLSEQVAAAGFTVKFSGQRPAEPDEPQPQGYLVACKNDG